VEISLIIKILLLIEKLSTFLSFVETIEIDGNVRTVGAKSGETIDIST
jgi:hypothetical protein